MFKLSSAVAALALAGAAIAQSTQPGQTTPSVTPSDTPAVTPSQTPGATPPAVIPATRPPVIGEGAVSGLSRCENLLGFDKDKCLQDERSGTTSSAGRPAGAGGSHAPGSTGTGAGTMGAQQTAPAGTVR